MRNTTCSDTSGNTPRYFGGAAGPNDAALQLLLLEKLKKIVHSDPQLVGLLTGDKDADHQKQDQEKTRMMTKLQDEISAASTHAVPGFRARAFEFGRQYVAGSNIRTWLVHAGILVPWLFEVVMVKHHFLPHRVWLLVLLMFFYFAVQLAYVFSTGVVVRDCVQDGCGTTCSARVWWCRCSTRVLNSSTRSPAAHQEPQSWCHDLPILSLLQITVLYYVPL